MSSATPWMKFYPQDWRSDEKLRLCSLAARGLWMEMIAIMHRCDRYGYLLINDRVPTDAQLAMQTGALPDQVSALMVELENAGVFSRTVKGVIYSRRMTRDAQKAATARKNGKKGGNPTLRKQTENSASDNPEDKPPDKGGVKAQRPEARSSVTKVTGGEPPPDPGKLLWDLGVQVLVAAGEDPRSARSITGKWRKEHGDARTFEALTAARTRSISDPVKWVTKWLASSMHGQAKTALSDAEQAARRYAHADAQRQLTLADSPPRPVLLRAVNSGGS